MTRTKHTPIRTTRRNDRPDAQRRRRTRLWIGVALAAFAALIALDRAGYLFAPSTSPLDGLHVRISGATCENGLIVLVDAGGQGEWGVRLLGLDARTDECEAAANAVARRFTNTRAIIRAGPYGAGAVRQRMHARIELSNGSDLGGALLGAGLARVDEKRMHSLTTRYVRAQAQARQRGLGVWADEPNE